MNKVWIPVIVALISIIPLGGGAATNWTFQIGDNTNIENTETSGDSITNFFGEIGEGVVKEGTLAYICTQNTIPSTHTEACEQYNEP
jgi:hypothetical protein